MLLRDRRLRREGPLGVALMGGGAAPFVGAYDGIANLVHVYEPARRTLSSYTGDLLRIRRDDDAEANFTYVSDDDPELDVAAIAAWLGASAGYVVTVYDQAGGDDVTQATEGSQPAYTASAQNSHAGLTFAGAQLLQGAFTNGGALSQPVTYYTVAKLNAAAAVNRGIFDGDDVTNRIHIYQRASEQFALFAGTDLLGNASDVNWNLFSALANGASSQFWKNGVSEASGNAGAQNPDGLIVGNNIVPNAGWLGLITSVVICDPSHDDTQRISMQTVMNSYWAVYV